MSAGIPTSLELWAAAKVIGRECSAINREFFICKKERGGAPGEFTVCCSVFIVTEPMVLPDSTVLCNPWF